MVENDILSFTEISTFPVCGWHKKRSCVRAPVNVYLAHRHCFTILCCLDVDISTQMFTVFDLCLHFLGVNPRSIMNTFVLRFDFCLDPLLSQIFVDIMEHLRGQRRCTLMPTSSILKVRGGCVESASPRHRGTSTVMYCPSVALKFFCQHSAATLWGGTWWMPLHVTDISAPIDYCNISYTAWHKCVSMTAHLSSKSSFSFFLSSICQGPLDKQVKNIIQSQSC